jgi:hypothetical protein
MSCPVSGVDRIGHVWPPHNGDQQYNSKSVQVLPRKSRRPLLFNAIPALISPQHALESADPELWLELKEFYKKIRNRIFHGYWISVPKPADLESCFEMFRRIYGWVGKWHALELAEVKPFYLKLGSAKFRMRSYRKTNE